MEQNRFIKRNKKSAPSTKILRINFSSSHPENVKRCPLSLKFRHPIICIALNRHYVVANNLRKSVKILISEHFTLLEWFPLTISKKYILSRSTNLCSRNHSMLFLIKKRLTDVQYLISNFK